MYNKPLLELSSNEPYVECLDSITVFFSYNSTELCTVSGPNSQGLQTLIFRDVISLLLSLTFLCQANIKCNLKQ